MKIAVTSETAQGLNSAVSHHFGRCPHYTLVTVENNAIVDAQSIPNPGAGGHNPGELPAFIKSHGVDVLLTGGMGPRAVEFFTRQADRVHVHSGVGQIFQVMEQPVVHLFGDVVKRNRFGLLDFVFQRFTR